ncbi:MAG: DUF2461 domain-containing protein [Rhodothermales bacterium]|nr:DUF2461 domain-containing protein [Rhodothermales bacterium]
MANPYITTELFAFLRDLKENNDRDWFQDNKSRYEHHVKEPLLDMIADFAPLLQDISPHYLAVPKTVGGSLFRIYRDVRFSTDKRPYKTHAGVHFRHKAGKDVHAPGYYLHVEPDQVFAALGVWHPPTPVLTGIRNRIAEHPEVWTQVREDDAFSNTFELRGESLKRLPRGFSDDAPHGDDLKRKDFIGVHTLSEEDALASDVLPRLNEIWSRGTPFMSFICGSVDVPF